MSEEGVKQRPSYQVRLPPPKPGWFKKFFNAKNKQNRIAQLYAFGGICGFIYIMKYLKKSQKDANQTSTENGQCDGEGGQIEPVVAKPTVGSLKPPFKAEIIIEKPGFPTIGINEELGMVETTFKAPFIGRTQVRAPLSRCLHDEDGNLVFDEYGFPVIEDSVFIKFIKEKYSIFKEFVYSLGFFK